MSTNNTVYALQSGYEQVGWISVVADTGYPVQHDSTVRVDSDGDVHVGTTLVKSSDYRLMHIGLAGSTGYVEFDPGVKRTNFNTANHTDSYISGDYVYTIARYYSPFNTKIWKTDKTGTHQALYGSGMSNRDVSHGRIAADSSQNMYLLSRGEYPNFNDWYVTLQKINSAGTLQWSRYTGYNGHNYFPGDIELDSNGNIYVTATRISGTDVLAVVKYNSSGTLQWERELYGSSLDHRSEGIAVDSDGNVYVSHRAGSKAGLTKLSSTGSITWQKQFATSATPSKVTLAHDTTNNRLYLAANNHDTDGGTSYGAFIAKLDYSGNVDWQRTFKRNNTSNVLYLQSIDCNSEHLFISLSNYTVSSKLAVTVLKAPLDGKGTGTYTDFKYLTESVTTSTSGTSVQTPTHNNSGTSIAGSVALTTITNSNWNFFASTYVVQVEVKEISVDAGSFTLTGLEATFGQQLDFEPSIGSFTLTGNSSALSYGAGVLAAAGAFALGLKSTALAKQSDLAASTASFAFIGNTASVAKQSQLAASSGSFALAGQAVNLRAFSKLSPATGQFLLSAEPAGILNDYKLSASSGSFAVAGNDIATTHAVGILAQAQSFSLSAQQISISRAYVLSAAGSAFTLTGVAAGFAEIYLISPSSASFVFSGNAAGLKDAERLAAGSASYALTGSSASLAVASGLSAAPSSFTLTAAAATLRKFSTLSSTTGAFLLQGQAVGLLKASSVALQAGSFTATGNEAGLTTQSLLSASVQSFSFVGLQALIEKKRVFQLASGAFALTGQQVALAETERLQPALGQFVLSAEASQLVFLRRYESGAFQLTGPDIELAKHQILSATRGRFRCKFTGRRQVVIVF